MNEKLRLCMVESELKYRIIKEVDIYNKRLECGDTEYAIHIRELLFELFSMLAIIGSIIMIQGNEVYDARYTWLLPYEEVIYNNNLIYRRSHD